MLMVNDYITNKIIKKMAFLIYIIWIKIKKYFKTRIKFNENFYVYKFFFIYRNQTYIL